ncbi:MAG: hypothetical protein LBH81_02280, partial [Rickettsiales bacterium]|nr:hypothetical protein [Rickettsiales bacterium]
MVLSARRPNPAIPPPQQPTPEQQTDAAVIDTPQPAIIEKAAFLESLKQNENCKTDSNNILNCCGADIHGQINTFYGGNKDDTSIAMTKNEENNTIQLKIDTSILYYFSNNSKFDNNGENCICVANGWKCGADTPDLKLANLSGHNLTKASRWVGADGQYSGFRYGVDAGVGVALGAVGAIVTNKMMKSSQKDAGFDK